MGFADQITQTFGGQTPSAIAPPSSGGFANAVLNLGKSNNVPTPAQSKVAVIPNWLGGGAYNVGSTPDTLINTGHSNYAGEASQSGMERNDLIPVSLGGANSNPSNIQMQPMSQAAPQDKLEAQLARDVKSGKTTLGQARVQMMVQNQKNAGLIPKQGLWANFADVIKQSFKDVASQVMGSYQQNMTPVPGGTKNAEVNKATTSTLQNGPITQTLGAVYQLPKAIAQVASQPFLRIGAQIKQVFGGKGEVNLEKAGLNPVQSYSTQVSQDVNNGVPPWLAVMKQVPSIIFDTLYGTAAVQKITSPSEATVLSSQNKLPAQTNQVGEGEPTYIPIPKDTPAGADTHEALSTAVGAKGYNPDNPTFLKVTPTDNGFQGDIVQIKPSLLKQGYDYLFGETGQPKLPEVVQANETVVNGGQISTQDLMKLPEPGAAPIQPSVPPTNVPLASNPEAGFVSPQSIAESVKGKVNDVQSFIKQTSQGQTASGNLSDELYKLQTNDTADKLLASQLLKKTGITSQDAEAIYHYEEDPTIKLTPKQQEIYDTQIKPLAEASSKIATKLKPTGMLSSDQGYTPRFVQGKGSVIDRLVEQGKQTIIGAKGRSLLRKTTGSLKHRVMKALVDENGNRTVAAIKGGRVTAFSNKKSANLGELKIKTNEGLMEKETQPVQDKLEKIQKELKILQGTKGRQAASPKRIETLQKQQVSLTNEISSIEAKYNPDELNGKKFVSKNGKTYTIQEATTKEIEKHTNLTYHKNVLANRLTNYLQLRRNERATDFLNKWKESPEFKLIAKKFDEGVAPQGWRPVSLPQFMGYNFEPHVAATLNKFAGDLQRGGLNIAEKVNRFLRTTIFFNPMIHIPNIGVHWAVNRGVTPFLNPAQWPTFIKTSMRALNAVIHQNSDYVEMLRSGAPLLYGNENVRQLTDLLVQKMATDLQNPQFNNIKNLLHNLNPYVLSGKATWLVNDLATMQAIYEEMAAGRDIKEAILETGKHIPNYRLPAHILNSESLAKALRNPNLTMFGAYHYGALRSYLEMAKTAVDANGKTGAEGMKERAKILDKLAMMGLIMFVIYPFLDKLAKKVTGNKNAMLRRAGATTFPYNTYKLATGQIQWFDYLSAIVTPAVGTKEAAQLALNKDLRTGQPIVPTSPFNNPKQAGEYLLNDMSKTIAPLNQYQQVQSGSKTIKDFISSLFGISSPKNSPTAGRLTGQIYSELPALRTKVKQLYIDGKTDEAKQIIDEYNQRLFENAKSAAQAQGLNTADSVLKNQIHRYQLREYTPAEVQKFKNQKAKPTVQKVLTP